MKTNRKRQPLFECLECHRKFYTAKAADRAAFGDNGCPGCGGSDIGEYTPEPVGGFIDWKRDRENLVI